jgi:anti-anti-sigma factor
MTSPSQDIPGVSICLVGKPEIAVFSVVGHVDRDCLSQAAKAFGELVEQGPHRLVVLDLSAAEYVSSTGIGVVAYYAKYLEEHHGKLVIVRGPDSVMKRVGPFLVPLVQVMDTRAEAIALLRALPAS